MSLAKSLNRAGRIRLKEGRRFGLGVHCNCQPDREITDFLQFIS